MNKQPESVTTNGFSKLTEIKLSTNTALGATQMAMITPGFIYGIDPAHGDDHAVRVKYEKLADGSLRMIDTQIWDKLKEDWVSHVG